MDIWKGAETSKSFAMSGFALRVPIIGSKSKTGKNTKEVPSWSLHLEGVLEILGRCNRAPVTVPPLSDPSEEPAGSIFR